MLHLILLVGLFIVRNHATSIGGVGGNVTSFRILANGCSLDGLRVSSDFQVEVIPLGKKGNWGPFYTLCGDGTQVFYEEEESGGGILVRMRWCWNASEDKVVVYSHHVRVKDPDGWMVEKFLLRVLQQVDIGQAMEEFGGDEWKDLEETGAKRKNTKWGCSPETPSVNLVPGFGGAVPMETGSCRRDGGTCMEDPPIICGNSGCCHYSSDSCGCFDNSTGTCKMISTFFETKWTGRTEDGLEVTTELGNYFPSSGDECQGEGDLEEGASVSLKQGNEKEWSLSVTIGQCVKIPGRAGILKFFGRLDIRESSGYRKRLFTVLRGRGRRQEIPAKML